MFPFDKHAIVSTVGPLGTRYSLSPLMAEQNKAQRYAEDRAHHEAQAAREFNGKLAVARSAKLVGGNHHLGVRRRPQGQKQAVV